MAADAQTTRLAIYGGAFDPIHNGHLATIGQLLASGQVDKVVVVPSGDRPDKKLSVSAMDRLAMTRLAIEEGFPHDDRVFVSDLHTAGTVGYGTIDLVDHFSRQPGIAPYVILGQELLGDLSNWRDAARLQAIARFIVIRRPGSLEQRLPTEGTCAWLQAPHDVGVLVSSTTLRGMLAKGLSCAGLLPPSVIAFCRSRGLYGAKT